MPATQVIVFEKRPSLEPELQRWGWDRPVRVRAARSRSDLKEAVSPSGRGIVVVLDEVGEDEMEGVLEQVTPRRHWIILVTTRPMTREGRQALRERGACCLIPFLERRALLPPLLSRLLNLSQTLQQEADGRGKTNSIRWGNR